MKRRTFVKTVLGALAAVGCGTKLVVDQGLTSHIIGNDGPHGCEGVHLDRIYLWPYKAHEQSQMLFVSDPPHGLSEWVDVDSYRLVYQEGLLKNRGPLLPDPCGNIVCYTGKNYIKMPLAWLS